MGPFLVKSWLFQKMPILGGISFLLTPANQWGIVQKFWKFGRQLILIRAFRKKKHFKSTREYWIVPFSQTVPLKQNKFRSLKLLVFNSNIKKTHKTKIWIQSITIDCDLWIAIRSGSKSKKIGSRSKIFDRNPAFSDFDRQSDRNLPP